MSIRMAPGMARLAVLGKGWNDNTVIDSGGGFTVDEGFWGGDDELWDGGGFPGPGGGDVPPAPDDGTFRFTVRTDYSTSTVSFWYQGRIKVDWGDGAIDDDNAPSSRPEVVNSYTIATHSYAEASADYTISITGDLQGISFIRSRSSPTHLTAEFGRVTAVLTPFPPTMRDVVDFSGVFQENTDLTSVPAGLFYNCPNVTDITYAFFNCMSLASIPAGLFYNCQNVTSFEGVFANCALTSIPAGLFDNCQNVTNFSYAFSGCQKLTSIPAGLFDNCPNVTNFSYAFVELWSLTSIPAGLFDNCPNVTNFYDAFCDCALTSIPAGLFDNCPNVTNFSCAFSGCDKIDSALPELWNTHPGAYGRRCFSGCKNASNYASVPDGWR